MLYIITTPRVYQLLKKEIAHGIKEGQISNPITYDEAKKLPYLQVSSTYLYLKTSEAWQLGLLSE